MRDRDVPADESAQRVHRGLATDSLVVHGDRRLLRHQRRQLGARYSVERTTTPSLTAAHSWHPHRAVGVALGSAMLDADRRTSNV